MGRILLSIVAWDHLVHASAETAHNEGAPATGVQPYFRIGVSAEPHTTSASVGYYDESTCPIPVKIDRPPATDDGTDLTPIFNKVRCARVSSCIVVSV